MSKAPFTGTRKKIHDDWLAAADTDEPDLDLLFEHLPKGTKEMVDARLAVLASMAPSPRIRQRLVDEVLAPVFTSLGARFVMHTALAGILAQAWDLRVDLPSEVPTGGDYRTDMEDWRQEGLQYATEALAGRWQLPVPHPAAFTPPDRANRSNWLGACSDPRDGVVDWLVANPPRHAKVLLQGCADLTRRPADPRIADFLAEQWAAAPDLGHIHATKVWLYAALLRHGDQHTARLLDGVDAGAARVVAARLRRFPERPAIAAVRAVHGVEAPPPERDPDQIIGAVYGDPGNADLRAVYQDVLLERADPRGDFLVLQRLRQQRALTEDEELEEESLLRQHLPEWLGALAKVVPDDYPVAFENGFLSHLFLNPYMETARRHCQRALGAAEWSTVQGLHLGESITDLESCPLASLTWIDGHVTFNAVKKIIAAGVAPKLARVGVAGSGKLDKRMAGMLKDLPALRELRIDLARPTSLVTGGTTLLDVWKDHRWDQLGLQRLCVPWHPAVIGLPKKGSVDDWLKAIEDAVPPEVVLEFGAGRAWVDHRMYQVWFQRVPVAALHADADGKRTILEMNWQKTRTVLEWVGMRQWSEIRLVHNEERGWGMPKPKAPPDIAVKQTATRFDLDVSCVTTSRMTYFDPVRHLLINR